MFPNALQTLLLRHAQRTVAVLVCLSLGMHWALLQGIAWTGMFISFASEGTVIEAVGKTFDGQHGCVLCQTVKEGQSADDDQPQHTGSSMKKIDAVLVKMTKLVNPPAGKMIFADQDEDGIQTRMRPEMPPPRRGLA
jgi:hypothetical protein